MRQGRYQRGSQVGTWTSWHPNGKRATQGPYRRGRRHGTWQTWQPDGKPLRSVSYRDGKRHGSYVAWYEQAATKRIQGHYDLGRRTGLWTGWHRNKKRWFEGYYSQGRQVGRWTWWSPDGQVARSQNYSAGTSLSPKQVALKRPKRPKRQLKKKHKDKTTPKKQPGIFFRNGPYSLRLRGLLLTRLRYLRVDEARASFRFELPVASIELWGTAFSPRVGYYFRLGAVEAILGLFAYVLDLFIVPKQLVISIGQDFRPSALGLRPEGLMMTSGSILGSEPSFRLGTDLGVLIHSGYSATRFFYGLGVYNGQGVTPTFKGSVEVDTETGRGEVTNGYFTNTPERLQPTLLVRLGYNHGLMNTDRTDLRGGPLRFVLSAVGLLELDYAGDGTTSFVGTFDAIAKLYGLTALMQMMVATRSTSGLEEQRWEAVGLLLQTGLLLWKQLQPAFRYALVATPGTGDRFEIGAGLSYFVFGSKLKLQTDTTMLATSSPQGRLVDWRVNMQVFLRF